MKEFLRKIKLIDELTVELDVQKNTFVTSFMEHVDEGGTGIFSGGFDIFSSSKNEFKGEVGYDGFKIRRRKRMFDRRMNVAVASGTYTQIKDRLLIETEINGAHAAFIPLILIAVAFYVIVFGFMFSTGESMIPVPFLLLHALLMLGIPYIMLRRSVKRMKHELEREFYFILKK